jgi:hypothetical protein
VLIFEKKEKVANAKKEAENKKSVNANSQKKV